jgi:predicted secreted protein
MEPIHGRDALVSIKVEEEFYPVLCAIDMTFSCSQQVLLATSADSGNWRYKRLRNLSEWSVSVSGLTKIDNTDGQASFFYLLQQNIRGTEQEIQIMFSDDDGNVQVLEGVVLIPEMSINGNVNGFADASVVFEGTGPFEITEPVSAVESAECEVIMSDTWVLGDGSFSISGAGEAGGTFEGKEVLEVAREGTQFERTTGSPGNREYRYNGTTIAFEIAGSEYEERVFVMWKQ